MAHSIDTTVEPDINLTNLRSISTTLSITNSKDISLPRSKTVPILNQVPFLDCWVIWGEKHPNVNLYISIHHIANIVILPTMSWLKILQKSCPNTNNIIFKFLASIKRNFLRDLSWKEFLNWLSFVKEKSDILVKCLPSKDSKNFWEQKKLQKA